MEPDDQLSMDILQDTSLLKPKMGCDVGLWGSRIYYTKPTEAVKNAVDIITGHRRLKERMGKGYQTYIKGLMK